MQADVYKLNGYGDDYQTGRTADGRQVVLGLLCPELVAFFFSPDGGLLEVEARPWEYPAPRMGADGPYRIYDPEFERRLEEQFGRWKADIGFEAATVHVKPFFDKEHWVGIETLPDYCADSIEMGDMDEASLAEWTATGTFVFYWAKDYIVGADGEVQST